MKIEKNQKNVFVTLQMSRVSSTDLLRDGCFNLTVNDNISRIRILDVYIKPEELANLISNRHTEPCIAELCLSQNIGKKREHKEVVLELEQATELDLKAHCLLWNGQQTEGWKISEYDMKFNHHRYSKGKYTVSADRYIDIPLDK